MERTLPYSAYVTESALEAERSNVFAKSWQYLGSVADFQDGVRSIPMTVHRFPLVLTRPSDERIQTLVNVCAHRGSIVCTESSTRDSLTCPYHAWRYGLDGILINAPRASREPDFDTTDHFLERLPTERWGPFIFGGLSEEVVPFDEFLGDLPEEVEAAGINVEKLQFHHRTSFSLDANWKIVAENFLECYHCRVAHPDFAKTIDTSPDEYLLMTAPTYSTQYGPVRNGPGVIDTSGEIERSQFHLLYPNTAINIMPGRANLSIGPINPDTPGTTDRFLDYFFAPDAPETWIDAMVEFDDQVGREDVTLVEDMQVGVAARPQRRGTLFMDSEKLIRHFESYLEESVDYYH